MSSSAEPNPNRPLSKHKNTPSSSSTGPTGSASSSSLAVRFFRPRGHSTSSLRRSPPPSGPTPPTKFIPLTKVASNPLPIANDEDIDEIGLQLHGFSDEVISPSSEDDERSPESSLPSAVSGVKSPTSLSPSPSRLFTSFYQSSSAPPSAIPASIPAVPAPSGIAHYALSATQVKGVEAAEPVEYLAPLIRAQSLHGTSTPLSHPPRNWYGISIGAGPGEVSQARRAWKLTSPKIRGRGFSDAAKSDLSLSVFGGRGEEVVKSPTSEQSEGWAETRAKVGKALRSVGGDALNLTHELLEVSVEVMEFAPIPGLASAANMLLNIWNALQGVDMNRLACLRLTSRCADILLSIREEIYEAGDKVAETLVDPIQKLTDSFQSVYAFLVKQNHRPFLKRYLKRDEILREIEGCDKKLSDILNVFSVQIQIKILQKIQESEERRREDERKLLAEIQKQIQGYMEEQKKLGISTPDATKEALILTDLEEDDGKTPTPGQVSLPHSIADMVPLPYLPPSRDSSSTIKTSSHQTSSTTSISLSRASSIQSSLSALRALENCNDASSDAADLRALMRAALGTASDAELIEVLQVGRDEMPEAIKALQRALERVDEEDAVAADSQQQSFEAGSRNLLQPSQSSSALGLDFSSNSATSSSIPSRRKGTMDSSFSGASATGSTSSGERDPDRTLDREFMESGIDALRRISMSTGVLRPNDLSLPSWTITRYEVDRERKIGIGFFSDVYYGHYRERPVAIKVLAPSTTNRELFIKEVKIWKKLRHENVLELIGASSAVESNVAGEGGGAWFLVSPYCKNGNLVQYLRTIGGEASRNHSKERSTMLDKGKGKAKEGSGGGSRIVVYDSQIGNMDLLKMMYEIAKGMEYLHARGVLHGDLKATNVLVDDKFKCVISDFGQSELKSEAYRISGAKPPHGTLRWQAPELIRHGGRLTTEMDVYAFAIVCIEILSMGKMPWTYWDDDNVRYAVLEQGARPEIPQTRFTSPALAELIQRCWHPDPFARPTFFKIVSDLKLLRAAGVAGMGDITPATPLRRWEDEGAVGMQHQSRLSPDMKPKPLPFPGLMGPNKKDHTAHPTTGISPPNDFSESEASYRTAKDGLGLSSSNSPPTNSSQRQHHHRSLSSSSATSTSLSASVRHTKKGHQRFSSQWQHNYTQQASSSHEPGFSQSGRRLSIAFQPTVEDTVASTTTSNVQIHGPILFTPSPSRTLNSSRASSMSENSDDSHSDSEIDYGNHERVEEPMSLSALGLGPSGDKPQHPLDKDSYHTPPPPNERVAQARNERRYRLLLTHEFHPSLVLPLWTPIAVQLGAVGYLSKPSGSFVTLFNSFSPLKSSMGAVPDMPSLYGYGDVTVGNQKLDKRTVTQRGMDAITGFLTFKSLKDGSSSQNVSRRHPYSLRAGHKCAYMYTEATMYRYMDSLDAPRKWFKANVEGILQVYGTAHGIQKEDVFLVIGTLNSPDYGLFVSHSHPDAQTFFNVFSSQPKGSPWGAFTTDTHIPAEIGGPSYDEPATDSVQSACVVSAVGEGWKTLLLARLRFKPDATEPTSL